MDFNLIFQPLVAVLWYLIPFLIIAGIVKTPWFKSTVPGSGLAFCPCLSISL